MKSGFTKRWRKRWETGYHRDTLLWVMMDYFIDHANWEDRTVFLNGRKLSIKRGQHVFGTKSLADFFGVGRQQIRTRLEIMKKIGFLTIQSTNRYSIATICNYDLYQSGGCGRQPAKQPTTNQQATTPKEMNNRNEKRNTTEVPEQIAALKQRYQDPRLIDEAIQAFSTVRKSGKISASVIIRELKKWEAYPASTVEESISLYLQKHYAEEGKGEAYLLGIIRSVHNKSILRQKPMAQSEYRQQEFNFERQFKSI